MDSGKLDRAKPEIPVKNLSASHKIKHSDEEESLLVLPSELFEFKFYLLIFLQVSPKSLLDLKLQATSAVYRLQLLERSDLPKTLLLSMAALQDQPSIKLQLLQTLQLLSSASDMNCTLILDAGGAEMICLHMNDGERSSQVLLCSLEILWNLLESRSKEEAMTQLSSMECVLFREELVMVNLLQLVNPPVAYPEHRPASPHCFITQQEELQLQALDGLASIAPVMLHDYMSCQGNTCLLLLLERCTNKGPLQCQSQQDGPDAALHQSPAICDGSGRPGCKPGPL
ncbi:hypothetical protein XENOCAPTIV_005561 [Xenoophorus captivus]|uniref:Cilia- and flagella-associated protein 69 ARM repeats domain-containing protein n=1 Tax=Xenoophorus captivus TaxID=1517983 RepID=A0ABV0SDI3_9TELE